MPKKPYVLCVLDGWGEDSPSPYNAISLAQTPHWNGFKKNYPFTTLEAAGEKVGLPNGQMGNSEVGHMNIGAGRLILQDLPRINLAIEQGDLAHNQGLKTFITTLPPSHTCHLMGLLSPGGVHSHSEHILELIRILDSQAVSIIFHAFLDGRDTSPKSAYLYMQDFLDRTRFYKNLSIGTLSGRYYAMDRDQRWDRIEKAYKAIVWGEGQKSKDPLQAIKDSYEASVSDEFILPTVIEGYKGIKEKAGLLMANFRADRVRQLLTTLTDSSFKKFPVKSLMFSAAVGMVEYSTELTAALSSLFPSEGVKNSIGEIIAAHHLTQLRIAETEKYAHVTFFLNGGREEPFKGEDRLLIPSPKVATYDLKPEMSAYEMTSLVIKNLREEKYDFIVVNYANTDMVGHTGDLQATIKAVEAVDACLGDLATEILKQGGVLSITADHGNAESMFDETSDSPHTAHTCNLVPFLVIGENLTFRKLKPGILADIAPTLLDLMGLEKPKEMSGHSLID